MEGEIDRDRHKDPHGEIDTEITVVIRVTDTGIAHEETHRQTHGYTRRERHR